MPLCASDLAARLCIGRDMELQFVGIRRFEASPRLASWATTCQVTETKVRCIPDFSNITSNECRLLGLFSCN